MEKEHLDLQEKLLKLQWLMQRQRMREHVENGPLADPTRGQGRVLAMLKLQPDISTKDLSYLLGIRQQSLNELLNKLEKNGLVTRVQSEDDKRVMLVRLTEKGENIKQADSDLDGIFDCLDDDEKAEFGKYLDRIIDSLEAALGLEEDEEFSEWIDNARSRIGFDKFERMMSMRGGMHRGFHGMAHERFSHNHGSRDSKHGGRYNSDENDKKKGE